MSDCLLDSVVNQHDSACGLMHVIGY